jgi:assimilatory nitrate reductase catalytic subunit
VITPPEGVRSDLEVMHELAARLGVEKGFPTDPEEVFEELRRASAGGPADYSGITYRRLAEENGVFWPCPASPEDAPGGPAVQRRAVGRPDAPENAEAPEDREDASPDVPGDSPTQDDPPVNGGDAVDVHPGTPRLFLDRFATQDGRARFAPVSHRAVAEEPDEEYPVLLTTGRVVSQYQSGAQTRRVDELNDAAPGPFVELHPRLAARLGAAEGDPVAVVSRRGRAVAPARITTGIRPDTVFMPFHWPGEGRANTLTNPALDPTSRMPEFKACAVRVEAVRP